MNKFLFLSTLIIFTACAAPSRVSRRMTLAKHSPSQGTYYSVKKGDSLWKISRKYGISVEELMRVNKIASPQKLQSGQRIFVRHSRRRPKTRLVFLWPVKGEIVNFFDEIVSNTANKGLNIKASPEDNQVKASARGKVVFTNRLKGWGRTVIVKHNSNIYTVYANLDETVVKEADFVQAGQLLGSISDRGGSRIVHFEIRKKYLPQDPLEYLN